MTDRHFAANNKKNNVLNCFLAAALAGCEPFFQMSIYPPAKIKLKVTKPKITSAKKISTTPRTVFGNVFHNWIWKSFSFSLSLNIRKFVSLLIVSRIIGSVAFLKGTLVEWTRKSTAPSGKWIRDLMKPFNCFHEALSSDSALNAKFSSTSHIPFKHFNISLCFYFCLWPSAKDQGITWVLVLVLVFVVLHLVHFLLKSN